MWLMNNEQHSQQQQQTAITHKAREGGRDEYESKKAHSIFNKGHKTKIQNI